MLRIRGDEVLNKNLRQAIFEMCLNCSGWYRKDTDDCFLSDCPLYPFRIQIGSRKQTPDDSVAIRRYCNRCFTERGVDIMQCPARSCPFFPLRNSNLYISDLPYVF